MKKYLIQSKKIKPILSALLAVFSSVAVCAAAPTVDSGSLLQQVRPTIESPPHNAPVTERIVEKEIPKPADGKSFLVTTIKITGDTTIDHATLHTLVADGEGKSLTLPMLNELAGRITNYYHNKGYPLARAVIPAQTIEKGTIIFKILMARYGEINLTNSSQVSDSVLNKILSPLKNKQKITQEALNWALMLLSDIQGIAVTATLKPGKTAETADLMVDVVAGSRVVGNVVADNYGTNFTGRYRAGGTFSFLNPLHNGDILSVSVLSSGSDLTYGRLSYDSLLNSYGTRVGGSVSFLYYTIGGTLTAAKADGTAQVANLWATQPFVRTRDINVYGQIQYERMQLSDHTGTIDKNNRHLDNLGLTLSGDVRDGFLSGSFNTWNLGMTAGMVGFDDDTAEAFDSIGAKTKGGFFKANANLVLLQSVSQNTSLYLSVAGQLALSNLDSSQKMSLGGPNSVRAYSSSAASGDSGYTGTAEVRYNLGNFLYGQWQAVGFVDSGTLTINKKPWTNTTDNSVTLSGTGTGLSWNGPSLWNAKVTVATPIGGTPTSVERSTVQTWIEIGVRF